MLDSLERNGQSDQRIYLVDNGSTDESLAVVAASYPIGGAYKRSIPRAFADGCDWVCLEKSDTLVRSLLRSDGKFTMRLLPRCRQRIMPHSFWPASPMTGANAGLKNSESLPRAIQATVADAERKIPGVS